MIRLGVAYGSDLEKVKRVLLQAAMEHPKVMHDPEPAVFFTTFGASTLDHELRVCTCVNCAIVAIRWMN